MLKRLIKWLLRPFAEAFAEAIVNAFMAHEARRREFVEARMTAEFLSLAKRVVEFQRRMEERGATPEEVNDFRDQIPQWMVSIALGEFPKARRAFEEAFQLREAPDAATYDRERWR
jgi:hypothetical protein